MKYKNEKQKTKSIRSIILFLFGSVTQMYFIHMLLFWQINVSTAQQQTIDTSEVSSVF